jgi:membrane-bound serine protease (ClpP class)
MNIADSLWQLLTNPNIVYLLLIAGVWSVALALTTPGTGLPESSAVVFLVLALLGLTRLPVNLFGLVLIFLSLILYVMELKWPSHGAFLLAGLLTLGGGSVFLFREQEGSARLSLVLVAVTLFGTAGFFAVVLSKAIEIRRLPPIQNPDAVLGRLGEARTDILKEGTVQVGSELWSAQADELIPVGTKVQIIQRLGLRLKVIRAGPGPAGAASQSTPK